MNNIAEVPKIFMVPDHRLSLIAITNKMHFRILQKKIFKLQKVQFLSLVKKDFQTTKHSQKKKFDYDYDFDRILTNNTHFLQNHKKFPVKLKIQCNMYPSLNPLPQSEQIKQEKNLFEIQKNFLCKKGQIQQPKFQEIKSTRVLQAQPKYPLKLFKINKQHNIFLKTYKTNSDIVGKINIKRINNSRVQHFYPITQFDIETFEKEQKDALILSQRKHDNKKYVPHNPLKDKQKKMTQSDIREFSQHDQDLTRMVDDDLYQYMNEDIDDEN